MQRAFRLALLVALIALLPLRGMAAVVADLCGPAHGGGMQASHECCAEGDAHAPSVPAVHDSAADGSCSHCAACSVGAPVVSDSFSVAAFARPGVSPIRFVDRRVPSVVPERLDRPPLAL